jgi:general secretion pathway protein A
VSYPIAPEVFYRDKSLMQSRVAYEGFFGLKENPFSLTSDPRYLFRTRHAHETLRQLSRGILTRRGLIVLSGDIGTGKTTLLNMALNSVKENPEVGPKSRTAVLVHPTFTRDELVEAILNEFEVPYARKARPIQALQDMLLEVQRKGGVVVLAIDEAQLLTHELLDQLRVLLGLRSARQPLLQVVLCGQPEMERKVTYSSLSRVQPPLVTLRCKTAPLSAQDTYDYIEHRLSVAGAKSESTFTRDAADAVHLHSHGIPRVVNLLCTHALSAAGLRGVRHITSQMVEEAAEKMPFSDNIPPGRGPRGWRPGNGTSLSPPSSSSAPPDNQPFKPGTAAKSALREPTDLSAMRKAPASVALPQKGVPSGGPNWPLLPNMLRPKRNWTADFAQNGQWMFFCHVAFIGALFLALARVVGSPAPWQHAAQAFLGFSGLLLLDVSLGLAAYVFLYERYAPPRLSALVKHSLATYRRLHGNVRAWLSAVP